MIDWGRGLLGGTAPMVLADLACVTGGVVQTDVRQRLRGCVEPRGRNPGCERGYPKDLGIAQHRDAEWFVRACLYGVSFLYIGPTGVEKVPRVFWEGCSSSVTGFVG